MSTPLPDDPRHALVIGVDHYTHLQGQDLTGARNSALAWCATLARLGFRPSEITLCADLDAPRLAELDRIFPGERPRLRGDTRYAIRSSTRALGEAMAEDPRLEAVLIYCGHSARHGDEVMMVPSDAFPPDTDDPHLVGLSLPAIRGHLASVQSRLVALFDACAAEEMLPDARWTELAVLAATAKGQAELEVSVLGRPMGAFSAAAALVLGSVKAGVGEGLRAYDLTVGELLERATETARVAFGVSLSPRLLNGDAGRAVLQRRDVAALSTTGQTVTGPGWQLGADTTWLFSEDHQDQVGGSPTAYPCVGDRRGYWAMCVDSHGLVVWQKVELKASSATATQTGWANLNLAPFGWITCWLTDEAVQPSSQSRRLFVAGQRADDTVVALAQSNNQAISAQTTLAVTAKMAMAPVCRGSQDLAEQGVFLAWSAHPNGGSPVIRLRRVHLNEQGALSKSTLMELPIPEVNPGETVSAPFLIRGELASPSAGEAALLVGVITWNAEGLATLRRCRCMYTPSTGALSLGDWTSSPIKARVGTDPSALPTPYLYKGGDPVVLEWRYEIAYVDVNGVMQVGHLDANGVFFEPTTTTVPGGQHFSYGRPALVEAAAETGLRLVAQCVSHPRRLFLTA